jgi:hypothetical protein
MSVSQSVSHSVSRHNTSIEREDRTGTTARVTHRSKCTSHK